MKTMILFTAISFNHFNIFNNTTLFNKILLFHQLLNLLRYLIISDFCNVSADLITAL